MLIQRLLSCITVLFFSSILHAQILSGSSSVNLSGPATKEQITEAREIAKGKLKVEVLHWLKEEQKFDYDTLNPLHMLNLDKLLQTFTKYSKEETAFQGKQLNLTYLLPFEGATKALQLFNSSTDSLAIQSWALLKSSSNDSNYLAMFNEGIKAYSYAVAHIGAPLQNPDDPEKKLAEEINSMLQLVLNKIKVSSSDMILQGKTGFPLQNPPVITVMIDSTPMPNISFTARLQTGTELFTTKSDDSGKVSLANLKVPFVSNGILLYVNIDPGKNLGAQSYLSLQSFGLDLKNSLEQSFMFKISRPSYKIEYKVTATPDIKISPDFSNSSYIKKYLHDSCYLQEASAEMQADFSISLNSQISKENFDATEETGIKATNQITISALTLDTPITKEKLVIYNKRYSREVQKTRDNQGVEIPYGLFFWEANVKIREAIKATMKQL
jgi:hypothetical protein